MPIRFYLVNVSQDLILESLLLLLCKSQFYKCFKAFDLRLFVDNTQLYYTFGLADVPTKKPVIITDLSALLYMSPDHLVKISP